MLKNEKNVQRFLKKVMGYQWDINVYFNPTGIHYTIYGI